MTRIMTLIRLGLGIITAELFAATYPKFKSAFLASSDLICHKYCVNSTVTAARMEMV